MSGASIRPPGSRSMDSLILTPAFPQTRSPLRRADQLCDPLERQHVALRPAADDDARSDARHVGMMPESFPLVHIGNMHLDDRPLEGVQRDEDGGRGMGGRGGIGGNGGRAVRGAVNPVDELIFAIALMEL